MSSTWSDSGWRSRLLDRLEPALRSPARRGEISTYQGVPFALFVYPPTEEMDVRREVSMLATRLQQEASLGVHLLSMAELMWEAIRAAFPPDGTPLFDSERAHPGEDAEIRLERLQGDMARLLAEVHPLPAMIQKRADALDPDRDVVFLTRVGALFPAYRASALLENLMGAVRVPTVLFYPGTRAGTNTLRFMDSLEALHGYRHRIY